MYDEIYQPTYGKQPPLRVHRRKDCRFRFCVIHNPQPGPWRDWPTNWRDDRKIMERVCPHGVGHPIAEDYARLNGWALAHGCDGCPCCPVIDGEIVDKAFLKNRELVDNQRDGRHRREMLS